MRWVAIDRSSDISNVRCERKKFVVKDVLADFQYYRDMQRSLHGSRYLPCKRLHPQQVHAHIRLPR